MNSSNTQCLDNNIVSGDRHFSSKIIGFLTKYSERFWFCIAFALFLLMGPFSIIAVVIGLWNLANSAQVRKMVEPAKG